MTGVVTQAAIEFARFADVMEYQHAARYVALAIPYRGSRALNIEFVAVPAYQQSRSHRLDRTIAPYCHSKRILERLAGFLVKAAKNFIDRPATRVVDLPAGQLFRDRVYVFCGTGGIGRNHAIAYGLQRDLCAFLLTKQRLFVQLALGYIDLDAQQAQQTAVFVEHGLGAAAHPAPVTILMPHPVHRFEERRVARKMLAHFRLHARHIIGMDELIPIQHDLLAFVVVSEHSFPSPGQIDALGFAIEVPDAVIGRCRNELVALVHLSYQRAVANAFQSGGKRGANQLEQQVQIGIPVVHRMFVGKSEETRHFVLNRKADHQQRADVEFRQSLQLGAGRSGPLERIGNLDHLEVTEPLPHPRPLIERFAGQYFRLALCKPAARRYY